MNKAIKYRIYPTAEQMMMFAKTFGCCRKVYNLMLADKIESYKETGKFVSVTPAKYKEEYPYLKEVDSLALANVQLNLQTAFRNTFDKSRKKKNVFQSSNLQSTVESPIRPIIKKVQYRFLIIESNYLRLERLKQRFIDSQKRTGLSNLQRYHWRVMGNTMYLSCFSLMSLNQTMYLI